MQSNTDKGRRRTSASSDHTHTVRGGGTLNPPQTTNISRMKIYSAQHVGRVLITRNKIPPTPSEVVFAISFGA